VFSFSVVLEFINNCSVDKKLLEEFTMHKIYNKLVRDRIPEIIKESKQIPDYIILSDEEYAVELDKKLKEETLEYLENKDIEELADVFEVLYAICEVRGISEEEIVEVRKKKTEVRGAFHEKILLKSVKKQI
jgi:predicted house-cleaning noncanonical NTP pyrophosphatase (MazG superfamily)